MKSRIIRPTKSKPWENWITGYFLKFVCLHDTTPYRPSDIVRTFMVLVSSFASIIAIMSCFKYPRYFINHQTPIIIPSWSASIILTCNALESPFGQPFSLFVGTIISCVLGISLTKIWMLNPANEDTLWVCAALAAALSSILMSWAKVIHPAACSAALLCAINTEVRHMGWFYLLVQTITSAIVIACGVLFSNLYAQYPLYWFLPPEPSDKPKITLLKNEFEAPQEADSLSTISSRNSSDTEEEPLPARYDPAESTETVERPIINNNSTMEESLFSLSREPTAEDEERSVPISETTDSPPQAPNQVTPTISRLSKVMTRSKTVSFAAADMLGKVITDAQWLRPINTNAKTLDRIVALLPGIDLTQTVVIGGDTFWFPRTVHVTSVEKGIMASIQRKLGALERQDEESQEQSMVQDQAEGPS